MKMIVDEILFYKIGKCNWENIKKDFIRVLRTTCFSLYPKQFEKEVGETHFLLTFFV